MPAGATCANPYGEVNRLQNGRKVPCTESVSIDSRRNDTQQVCALRSASFGRSRPVSDALGEEQSSARGTFHDLRTF